MEENRLQRRLQEQQLKKIKAETQQIKVKTFRIIVLTLIAIASLLLKLFF